MLAVIKEETVLGRAFEKYFEVGAEIAKLNQQIKKLKSSRTNVERIIKACCKANEGNLTCGRYAAKVVKVEDKIQTGYTYISITQGA